MNLSIKDRLILSNQFRILEALYPDEKQHFSNTREAIESGYEIEYDWQTQYIHREVVNVEECNQVIDILSMFDVLKHAYESIEDKSGIDEYKVKFLGFDGNNETKQMAYARYLRKNGKFTNLESLDDFNSHCPMLATYRRMLNEWSRSDKKYQLTKDDIKRITKAGKVSSLIEQNGNSEDDNLDELREMIYQARGRSENENEIIS